MAPGSSSALPGAAGRPARWEGLLHAVLTGAAGIIAYVPTQVLGLQEGFWAAITAIAVMQGEWRSTWSTGRDQLLGAAIGGIVALATLLVAGKHIWSYGLAVALAVLGCSLIRVSSAGRLAGITATIILLVPAGSLTPAEVAFWRVSEVAWGVVVTVSLVWIVEWSRRRIGGGPAASG